MDGTRFDAWTRRRFGMVTGGAAASLLGLSELLDADAKKNKKKKNKKKCKKLGQSCNQSKKKKKCCNKSQLCAQVSGKGDGNYCCKQAGQGCSKDHDCCGADTCDGNGKCKAP